MKHMLVKVDTMAVKAWDEDLDQAVFTEVVDVVEEKNIRSTFFVVTMLVLK